jgi:hypothetical protein
MPPDLSLASTRELIDELTARCDVLVISGIINMSQDVGRRIYSYQGGAEPCLGAIEIVKSMILDDFIDSLPGDDG